MNWTDDFDESVADDLRHEEQHRLEHRARVKAERWIRETLMGGGIHFIESPGHGWLIVPVEVVEAMDLIISCCSPRTKACYWLEEDRDLTTFVREVKEQFDITLTHNSFYTQYVEDIDAYWESNQVTW